MNNRLHNLTNQKFGYLTVISFLGRKSKHSYWKCVCDCGNETQVRSNNLKNGHVKSCGCYGDKQRSKTKFIHGKAGTSLYKKWVHMVERCTKTKDSGYKNYGGRGITVCDRWLKFKEFYEDMGDCPDTFQLERIDNNLGYFKENCKWASRDDQQRNKRNNLLITYKNKTQVLADWAKELNILYTVLHNRIKYLGWTVEKAFTKPGKPYESKQ